MARPAARHAQSRYWILGCVLGLGVAGAVAIGFATTASADTANQGAHGAAAMPAQLQALAPLAGPTAAAPTQVPAGISPAIWAAATPKDNAMTRERIALGRKLYFDTRLSKDGTVACATCHDVTRSFTDRRPVSEGIGGKLGQRNAPTTMNAALLETQFWDGRAATLEAQAVLPIVNPIEMGMPDGKAAVAAIASDPEYVRMFQAAYGRAPNYDDIGRALAAFQRTLIFLDAPFDRYTRSVRRGDASAGADGMSAAAVRGWTLFNGKARCVTCHPINPSNPLGTDNRFHNIGVSARNQDFEKLAVEALALLAKDSSLDNIDNLALRTDKSELGRFLVTKNYADVGAFRTPQIRNAGITAPYMHDGSMQTLWDVMDHYNKGGEVNKYLDGGIEALALTEAEIDDLVAFMFALTDVRFADLSRAEFDRQKQHAATKRPFRDQALANRDELGFGQTGKSTGNPAGGPSGK